MLSRRDWFRLSASGWLAALAAQGAAAPQRKRSCILLWMAGGPSTIDLFDLKPGHKNGGPFKPIATDVPGVQVGEHLPELAKRMKHLAVIRSMKSREGDHGRATAHLRTGYLPEGPIRFPSLGALVSNEKADPEADLPGFVSISPQGAFAQPATAAGFLGPRHAPIVVEGAGGSLQVEDLRPFVATGRAAERLSLLHEMSGDFTATRPGLTSHAHAYSRAVRLGKPAARRAFDLGEESASVRDRYGRTTFGQGCLMARRLVERGVPFVEVTLRGWDTHDNNFDQVKGLCGTLDPAWSALLDDLKERGLLDTTTIVWMGEFGRTPGINPRSGRDHFPTAWSAVIGGGGINGGQAIGATTKDGSAVEKRPVSPADFIATVCVALGLNPKKQNPSNVDRPIRLADPDAAPLREVLA
jgi:hypothetical protein